MSPTTPAFRDLARRLVDLEVRGVGDSVGRGGAAKVCENLRLQLTKLAGVAGYHSLVSRAVATARIEATVLQNVSVRSDGAVEGLEEVENTDFDATVALVAHLLSLLVTFVGEPLTLSLVGNAWPEIALRRSISKGEL